MSRFSDDFALAFDDVLFERGDPIEFYGVGEPVRPITAVVTERTGGPKQQSDHDTEQTVLEVVCKKSDIVGLFTGAYVVWEEKNWDFKSQLSDDGGVLRLHFEHTAITQAGKKPSQL